MARTLAVFVLLLTGVAGCRGGKPRAQQPGAPQDSPEDRKTATDEASAVELYKTHLQKAGWRAETIGALAISAKRMGGRWLVYSTPIDEEPSIQGLSVMGEKGGVWPDLVNGLVSVHMYAFPESEDPREHRKLIDSFTALHCSDGELGKPVYLSSVSDIPGYREKPLPADLEGVARPMWSYRDDHGRLVYVLSTYNRMGGKVRRYTFSFVKGKWFRGATCIELGRGIGDAIYRE